jgi:hypothetical protein
MSLSEIQAEIGRTNTEKGFRDLPTTIGDRLALVTSEVSEALEEIRAGHAPDEIYFGENVTVATQALQTVLDYCLHTPIERADPAVGQAMSALLKAVKKVEGKPEGYPVELADAAIRIIDEFDRIGLDAEAVIRQKMQFNAGRPFLHGGKVL